MNRRKFIAAAGSTSTLTLAGCTGTDSTPEGNQSEAQTDDTNSTTTTSTEPSGDFFGRIEFTQTGTIEVYTADTASEFSGVNQIAIITEDGNTSSTTSFTPENMNMVEFSSLSYRGDIRFQARNVDETATPGSQNPDVIAETDTYSYRSDVSLSGVEITPFDGARNPDSFYSGIWMLQFAFQNDGNAPLKITTYTLDREPLPYTVSVPLTGELYDREDFDKHSQEDQEFVALANTTTTAFTSIGFETRYNSPDDGEYHTLLELGDDDNTALTNYPPEPITFEFTGMVEGELYKYPDNVSVRLSEPAEE